MLSRGLREDRSNRVRQFRGIVEVQLQSNRSELPPGCRFDSVNRCDRRDLSSLQYFVMRGNLRL